MIVLRMRSSSEAKDMLKRIKKMAKYASELEDTLEECIYEEEEDAEFRDDEDDVEVHHNRGRRRYRKM